MAHQHMCSACLMSISWGFETIDAHAHTSDSAVASLILFASMICSTAVRWANQTDHLGVSGFGPPIWWLTRLNRRCLGETGYGPLTSISNPHPIASPAFCGGRVPAFAGRDTATVSVEGSGGGLAWCSRGKRDAMLCATLSRMAEGSPETPSSWLPSRSCSINHWST